jgi:hypothetical protein
MAVPYTFGSATTSIPLSQLDSNFATTITLGNTAIQLGNTVTTLNNMTLASPTLTTPALGTPSSGVMTNVTGIPAAQITGSQAIPKSTLPTGSVLQVVSSGTQTQVSSTSGSTWVDTGISLAITPTSATSTVLVLVSMNGLRKVATTNSGVAVALQLLRGVSTIANIGNDNASTDTTANGGYNTTAASTCYLDSPATTSSTTYKVQFNNARNAADTIYTQYNGARSTIILMEIAA